MKAALTSLGGPGLLPAASRRLSRRPLAAVLAPLLLFMAAELAFNSSQFLALVKRHLETWDAAEYGV